MKENTDRKLLHGENDRFKTGLIDRIFVQQDWYGWYKNYPFTKIKNIIVPKVPNWRTTSKFLKNTGKNIEVLRFPVGHSKLNPIKLILALVTSNVANKNTTFKISDVHKLIQECLKNLAWKNWWETVEYTMKIEEAFYKLDFGDAYLELIGNVL